MKKLAIISDIHGNLPALMAVLQDIELCGVSDILCLGDLVGYYCYFNEVVAEIKNRNISCIRGNHDHALVERNGVISTSKTCTGILGWQLQHAKPETINFLKSLEIEHLLTLGNKKVVARHAGMQDWEDEYLFDVTDDYLQEHGKNLEVLITGHTHLPAVKKFYSGKTWLNPGSVGQPRDHDPRASYAIIDENIDIVLRRVSYDSSNVITAMRQFGFADYITAPLINGVKIGFKKE